MVPTRNANSFDSFGTSRGIGARRIVVLIYSIDIRIESDCRLQLAIDFLVGPRHCKGRSAECGRQQRRSFGGGRGPVHVVLGFVFRILWVNFSGSHFHLEIIVDFPRFPSPVGRLWRAHEWDNVRENNLNPFISPLTRVFRHRNDRLRFIITDAPNSVAIARVAPVRRVFRSNS